MYLSCFLKKGHTVVKYTSFFEKDQAQPPYLNIEKKKRYMIYRFTKFSHLIRCWPIYIQIGGGNIDLGFHALVEDVDNPDSLAFSLVTSTYSNLFNISKTTGIITYAVDYDIDKTHPQNLSVIVKCTDTFGKTGNDAHCFRYISNILVGVVANHECQT